MRPDGPLLAVLKVMEALHAPSEAILQRLDAVFDPRRTHGDFVPVLAHWVDLQDLVIDPRPGMRGRRARRWSAIETARLRELVANAARLSKWRGTAKGLRMLLEITTGETGFEIEEQVLGADRQPKPFHFRVRIPKTLARQTAMIERIIELEKPAHVTYETQLG
jgi:phage tail-like protein